LRTRLELRQAFVASHFLGLVSECRGDGPSGTTWRTGEVAANTGDRRKLTLGARVPLEIIQVDKLLFDDCNPDIFWKKTVDISEVCQWFVLFCNISNHTNESRNGPTNLNMRLIIRSGPYAASAHVAGYIIDRINTFAPTAERPFVLGLPTGSSPQIIYKILVERYRSGQISFRNVITFNMVCHCPFEYVVPLLSFQGRVCWSSGEPSGELSQLHVQKLLLPRKCTTGEHQHMNGNASDLDAECAAYEEKIKKVEGMDLFLGGVGSDGHIAFNEPGSSLASRTRVKTLAQDTMRANARFFDNDERQVPQMALTVGVQTVMDVSAFRLALRGSIS